MKNQTDINSISSEIEQLQWENAGLISSYNALRNLRLMRFYDKFRLIRYRFQEALYDIKFLIKSYLRIKQIEKVSFERPEADLFDVILFSNGDWKWRYQRPQHLAMEWVKHHHRVFFIGPIFEKCSLHYLYKASPSYKRYSCKKIIDGLIEFVIKSPQSVNMGHRLLEEEVDILTNIINDIILDFQIRNAIIFVELPFWKSIALRLKQTNNWPLIYDCLDRNYGVYPLSHSMLSDEINLIRNSDLVVATSQLLIEDWANINSNIVHIPNGVNADHFSFHSEKGLLENYKHPIIGYIGNIAPWLDIENLFLVASRHPEWVFIMIGSGIADISLLKGLSNVHFLGEVPYNMLPGYLHNFDVCMIPFKILPVTSSTDPVKFYEYFSVGKPVVSSYLKDLSSYHDLVYFYTDAESMEQAINFALCESPEKPFERCKFIQSHTWEHRYKLLDQSIRKIQQSIKTQLSNDRQRNVIEKDQSLKIKINKLYPSATRVMSSEKYFGWNGVLNVIGDNFTEKCIVLVDEDPIPTYYINSQLLTCEFPLKKRKIPGFYMVSIMEKITYIQTNRRVFSVERV